MSRYLRTKLGIQRIFGILFISLLLFGFFVPWFLRAYPLTCYNQIGQQCVVPTGRSSQGKLFVVFLVQCLVIFLCCLVSSLVGGLLILLLFFFSINIYMCCFLSKKNNNNNAILYVLGMFIYKHSLSPIFSNLFFLCQGQGFE